mmetsp:Transcript_49333/g.156204  ORF Transcript_49333/g.156204 Transcript_49333/m.156204 type:complete len:290 (+) Transcript_49333:651-1520(+)
MGGGEPARWVLVWGGQRWRWHRRRRRRCRRRRGGNGCSGAARGCGRVGAQIGLDDGERADERVEQLLPLGRGESGQPVCTAAPQQLDGTLQRSGALARRRRRRSRHRRSRHRSRRGRRGGGRHRDRRREGRLVPRRRLRRRVPRRRLCRRLSRRLRCANRHLRKGGALPGRRRGGGVRRGGGGGRRLGRRGGRGGGGSVGREGGRHAQLCLALGDGAHDLLLVGQGRRGGADAADHVADLLRRRPPLPHARRQVLLVLPPQLRRVLVGQGGRRRGRDQIRRARSGGKIR